jgi:hypothetical protein
MGGSPRANAVLLTQILDPNNWFQFSKVSFPKV